MYRHAPGEAAGRRTGVAAFASAARRWWPIAVSTALLGGLLGLAATSDPSYNATLVVRVLSLSSDGQGFKNNGQTALRLMQTDEVFRRAAEILGEDTAALRARTAVTQVTETDLVEINVSGTSQQQPEREATSIATAAQELMEGLSRDQVAQLALSSNLAVVSGVLPNGAAELARQEELGKAAAARQDVGLATALTLSPVGTPELVRTGLPRSIAAAVGILVGALLGTAGAWLYGRRFGRLRRLGDVRAALPGSAVVEGGRLASVAHRYSDRGTSLIGLLALREATTELPALTRTLDAELRTDGRRPYLLDSSDLRQPGTAASGPGPGPRAAPPHPRADPASAPPLAGPEREAAEVHAGNGQPRPRPLPSPMPRPMPAPAVDPGKGAAAPPVSTAVHDEPRPVAAPEPPAGPQHRPVPVPGFGVPTNGHEARGAFVPSIGRSRERDLAVLGRDALVVAGSWDPHVAARLADRADVVLLIAKRGVTRLRDLAAAGRELGDTVVVVVVT